MILPTMMQHALLSFMMLFVTVNNYPQQNEIRESVKIIVVTDQMARELLISALKEELSKVDGLDAQVIDMCMSHPTDAIGELENSENDSVIEFYKRVRRRFTMLIGALS